MRRGASLLLVAAVLLAGCSDPPESKIDREGPGSRGSSYVALGDSYASGPRLGADSGPTGCEQTAGNYAHLLAERLGLVLTDATCGGSNTEDLAGSQTPPNGAPVPPQLDALDEETDLVTLGMGGNDGRVFSELMTTCVGKAVDDPDGAPCSSKGSAFRRLAERQLSGLEGRIADAVEAIRERAPHASVLVVGYPQIVPAAGTCALLPLAAGDYPYAREFVERVNAGLEAGATGAKATFVDVATVTDGHDICAADPWIAGSTPSQAALPYHPYADEQQAVADLLADELR